MCSFDSGTLRCGRCGFLAESLPHYRHCQTIEEQARAHFASLARERIRIPPPKIGSMIGAGLSAVGITDERVTRWLGKDCGCPHRRNKLNALAEHATKAISSVANRALLAMLPHPAGEEEVAALAQAIAASPLTNQGLRDKAAGR